MACSSCGKQKNRIFPVYSKKTTDDSYIENQDGVTNVLYTGEHVLRVRGCASGHVYMFGPGKGSKIDVNDFVCIKERFGDRFEEANDTKTDIGASKLESTESTEGISEGDGSVYTDSEQGLSGNSQDLE